MSAEEEELAHLKKLQSLVEDYADMNYSRLRPVYLYLKKRREDLTKSKEGGDTEPVRKKPTTPVAYYHVFYIHSHMGERWRAGIETPEGPLIADARDTQDDARQELRLLASRKNVAGWNTL